LLLFLIKYKRLEKEMTVFNKNIPRIVGEIKYFVKKTRKHSADATSRTKNNHNFFHKKRFLILKKRNRMIFLSIFSFFRDINAALRPVPSELLAMHATLRPVPTELLTMHAALRPVPSELLTMHAALRPVPSEPLTMHAALRPVPSELLTMHAALRPVPSELLAMHAAPPVETIKLKTSCLCALHV
jgi:hypothetical protein